MVLTNKLKDANSINIGIKIEVPELLPIIQNTMAEIGATNACLESNKLQKMAQRKKLEVTDEDSSPVSSHFEFSSENIRPKKRVYRRITKVDPEQQTVNVAKNKKKKLPVKLKRKRTRRSGRPLRIYLTMTPNSTKRLSLGPKSSTKWSISLTRWSVAGSPPETTSTWLSPSKRSDNGRVTSRQRGLSTSSLQIRLRKPRSKTKSRKFATKNLHCSLVSIASLSPWIWRAISDR